jgi:hypothetical protein
MARNSGENAQEKRLARSAGPGLPFRPALGQAVKSGEHTSFARIPACFQGDTCCVGATPNANEIRLGARICLTGDSQSESSSVVFLQFSRFLPGHELRLTKTIASDDFSENGDRTRGGGSLVSDFDYCTPGFSCSPFFIDGYFRCASSRGVDLTPYMWSGISIISKNALQHSIASRHFLLG